MCVGAAPRVNGVLLCLSIDSVEVVRGGPIAVRPHCCSTQGQFSGDAGTREIFQRTRKIHNATC
jgi:hypothetical protein